MSSVKALLCMGVCMTAWSMIIGESYLPRAENVHWESLDFKTTLSWDIILSEHVHTVLYTSGQHEQWIEAPSCIQISESECDLTHELIPLNSDYRADIKIDSDDLEDAYGLDYDLPHTYSPMFNPYKHSNISALEFSFMGVNKDKVILNIKHPLTSIFQERKQQSIKDILKDDLKYKISYYKSGSTRTKENNSDSSNPEVSGLDAGESYCFMVAAFIPSRPKANQLGAWSTPQCVDTDFLQDLGVGGWVGIIFILIAVLIIVITATILCCRRNQEQTSQSSAPV